MGADNHSSSLLTGTNLDRYRDDRWLVGTGSVVPRIATKANDYTPTFTVRSARPIPAPQDTYEY